MQKTIKIDINALMLCTVLESMTSFTYSKQINEKLHDFINYLIEIIYDDKDILGDIISQEYYCTTTYKKGNS